MRTLTRNVLSLWDEVTSPSCSENTLFSQSASGTESCDVPNHPDIVNKVCTACATFPVRDHSSKSKKRLWFGERNKKHILENSKTDASKSSHSERRGSGILTLVHVSPLLKNNTFPLFNPISHFESKLSSLIKALSLTGTHINETQKSDTTALRLVNRNNNSFKCLQEVFDPDGQTIQLVESCTREFDNDIKFLSSVPNKTSTPIKCHSRNCADSPARIAHACDKSIENEPKTYTLQASSTSANSNRKFPKWRYGFIFGNQQIDRIQHHVNCSTEDNVVDNVSLIQPTREEQEQKLVFASEDEEAVYYLMTKYLNE